MSIKKADAAAVYKLKALFSKLLKTFFKPQLASYIAIAYELTALSQLDMIVSYRVRHVPIHTVLASVAFPQVASVDRADRAIPQGPHAVSTKVAYPAAVCVWKASLKLKLRNHQASDIDMVACLGYLQRCLVKENLWHSIRKIQVATLN